MSGFQVRWLKPNLAYNWMVKHELFPPKTLGGYFLPSPLWILYLQETLGLIQRGYFLPSPLWILYLQETFGLIQRGYFLRVPYGYYIYKKPSGSYKGPLTPHGLGHSPDRLLFHR
jgi:hypothetical protein